MTVRSGFNICQSFPGSRVIVQHSAPCSSWRGRGEAGGLILERSSQGTSTVIHCLLFSSHVYSRKGRLIESELGRQASCHTNNFVLRTF